MSWIGKSIAGLAECEPPPTLSQEVALLLARLQPPILRDRRRASRTPIPYLFRFAPLSNETGEPCGGDSVVVGKDISARGIAFYHERPIAHRRGLLSLDLPGDGPVQLEVELYWCRSTSVGWYESGGRLLRVVSSGEHLVSRAG